MYHSIDPAPPAFPSQHNRACVCVVSQSIKQSLDEMREQAAMPAEKSAHQRAASQGSPPMLSIAVSASHSFPDSAALAISMPIFLYTVNSSAHTCYPKN